jgi:hypothetical protein
MLTQPEPPVTPTPPPTVMQAVGSAGGIVGFATSLAMLTVVLLKMYGKEPPAELASALTGVIMGVALFVVHRFPPRGS